MYANHSLQRSTHCTIRTGLMAFQSAPSTFAIRILAISAAG